MTITKRHCSGCYDDFYNHRTNCDGNSECWSLKSAKLVPRVAIPRDAPPPYRGLKTRALPDCYRQVGMCYMPPERIGKDGYWK